MKKEEFLGKIGEVGSYCYEDFDAWDYYWTYDDDITYYIFENAFDYSKLNQKITVEEVVEQTISRNILDIGNNIYEYIPHMKYKLDEAVLCGNYDNFDQLLKRALFEYQKDFIMENIENIVRIHYLTLAHDIIENSKINKFSEEQFDELNELVEQKVEEFCEDNVLNKYVPTEFTEFKEILNIKKTKKQEEILSL
ncbi:hypothetical protein [Mycoplasma anserisalpingitidis]|uniref:hypothetical protein n=1 Tax=Mycoplasma anserisalpingitidis TaxID=519450 RepID=UPI0011B1B87E|nr:hypothetical protein [Mycoplasma anserisalpingitidis]QDY87734.1 hypothetical protein FOY45_02230 [Mycoplasma anserisalpingitidis]